MSDGHHTDVTVSSVYCGVVSLHGIQPLVFLEEINEMEMRAIDIVNAYLQANTLEKVYIISRTKCFNRDGHILFFYKSLCGIFSSVLFWDQGFDDCLRNMVLCVCKLEPDI